MIVDGNNDNNSNNIIISSNANINIIKMIIIWTIVNILISKRTSFVSVNKEFNSNN